MGEGLPEARPSSGQGQEAGDAGALGFHEGAFSPFPRPVPAARCCRAWLGLFLPFISGKATGGEFPFSVCFDSVVFLKRGRKTIITFSVL